MKKLALLFVPIFLFGCTTAVNTEKTDTTDTPETTEVEETVEIPEVLALVDELKIDVVSEDPLQMKAIVKGHFRNSCEMLYKTKVTHLFKEKRFEIKMTTQPKKQEEGEICTKEVVPFEEEEWLPTQGVKAGEYIVDANGATKSFILE